MILGLQTREAVDCCKWSPTGYPNSSLKDSSARKNRLWRHGKRFQRAITLATGLEIILVILWQRMVQPSALVLRNLPESKLKSFALSSLTDEISRPPSIDGFMWLFMITLT